MTSARRAYTVNMRYALVWYQTVQVPAVPLLPTATGGRVVPDMLPLTTTPLMSVPLIVPLTVVGRSVMSAALR